MMRVPRVVVTTLVTCGALVGLLSVAAPALAVPEKPIVEGVSASGVRSSEARLEARVNPNSQTTSCEFEYGKTVGEHKEKCAPPSLEGLGNKTVSLSVATLEAGTIYHFRVVAKNATGETAGESEFTTVPVPHTEMVEAGTITATGAVFRGSLTPLNATVPAAYAFEYNVIIDGEGQPVGSGCAGQRTSPENAGTGSGTELVSTNTSGQGIELQPNVTYAVCLVASNAFGSETGQSVSFATHSAPPKIENENASVTPAGMQLEALINPNNEETNYEFEYSQKGSIVGDKLEGSIATAGRLRQTPLLKAVYGGQTASVATGAVLAPDTTYYYRVNVEHGFAEGNEGQYFSGNGEREEGKVQSFTTPPAPVVSVEEAQNITHSSVTVAGEVNDENVESKYYFEYISKTDYQAALAEGVSEPYENSEKTSLTSMGASTEPQAIMPDPLPISGLLPGEIYYYRLIARNPFGDVASKPGTFETLPSTPPIVSTDGVSGIGQTSATISGTVDTNSLQTEYGFEVATSPGDFGPATGLGSVGGQQTNTVTLTLSELQPGTTYYYRVTASNADGTTQGEPQSFTTVGLPDLFTVAPEFPLIAGPTVAFPTETGTVPTRGTTVKKRTDAQKLAKALKACRKDRRSGKRSKCEKAAQKKYDADKKGR